LDHGAPGGEAVLLSKETLIIVHACLGRENVTDCKRHVWHLHCFTLGISLTWTLYTILEVL